jgi:uncharacterized protein (TIGR03437 family)
MSAITATSIVAQLPFEVSGQANMILKSTGGVSNTLSFNALPTAPTVFRRDTPEPGAATVIRAVNAGIVTMANPIHPEDELIIYLTGMGRTTPDVRTGDPGPSDPLASAIVPPEVTLGNAGLPVYYAGLVPGEVGVYQIIVSVPWWVSTGMSVPLTIKQSSHSDSLNVRVVK